MDGLFAVTTADTDTVDNIALLGLVSKSARLVRPRRPGSAVDHVQLAVLPAAHTEEESEDIALLLLVKGRNLTNTTESRHKHVRFEYRKKAFNVGSRGTHVSIGTHGEI